MIGKGTVIWEFYLIEDQDLDSNVGNLPTNFSMEIRH